MRLRKRKHQYAHGTAIENQIDRPSLAMDAIDRTETQRIGAHTGALP